MSSCAGTDLNNGQVPEVLSTAQRSIGSELIMNLNRLKDVAVKAERKNLAAQTERILAKLS
jgi:hypothetical protein